MVFEKGDNRKLNGRDRHAVRQALEALLGAESPSRAIAQLASRCGRPDVPAFERYAGMVLRDAGGELLRDALFARNLMILRPTDGKMARLVGNRELDEDQARLLADLEDAINRLICIGDALEDGIDEAVDVSFEGVGTFSIVAPMPQVTLAGHRSAYVVLPCIGTLERADIAYFNEIDWRALDNVASNARIIFQHCIYPNEAQSVHGVAAPTGGDWDIRTRIAYILENLELSSRFTYRFDCDAVSGVACIRTSAPRPESLPSLMDAAFAEGGVSRTGRVVRVDGFVGKAQEVYALRLAAVLAAACFGSGRRVEHATVIVSDGGPDGGDVSFTCTFERRRFVRATLKAIEEGRLSDSASRFDPERILAALAPSEFCRGVGAAAGEMTGRVLGCLARQRVEPWQDGRLLPESMQSLLRAVRVSDIDAEHYLGGNAHVIDEARSDSVESKMTAIAYLEGVVEQLEPQAAVRFEPAPPSGPADAPGGPEGPAAVAEEGAEVEMRPLYCTHAAGRAAVALLGDELDVGAQAESFMQTGESGPGVPGGAVRYFRAPDALFQAHVGLSDLYQRIGDLSGADAHANRCIALGPTCAIGYVRKADVLAERRRYSEAANVILDGLRYAMDEQDCAMLYHDLALLFWYTNRRRESATLNVYASSLKGPYAEAAGRIVARLRAAGNGSGARAVPSGPRAAALELARLGIPVMPGKVARELVARVTLGLANASAPAAAAPYAAMLAADFADDRVVISACRSIQYGIGLDAATADGKI